MNPFAGQLRVWWVPECSDGKISSTKVNSIREAKVKLYILSESGTLKTGGLQVWNGYEWDEWYDDDDNDINGTELS